MKQPEDDPLAYYQAENRRLRASFGKLIDLVTREEQDISPDGESEPIPMVSSWLVKDFIVDNMR